MTMIENIVCGLRVISSSGSKKGFNYGSKSGSKSLKCSEILLNPKYAVNSFLNDPRNRTRDICSQWKQLVYLFLDFKGYWIFRNGFKSGSKNVLKIDLETHLKPYLEPHLKPLWNMITIFMHKIDINHCKIGAII